MNIAVWILPLLVLPFLAWLMRDIYRQQAKRDAARLRKFRKVSIQIVGSISIAQFVEAMAKVTRAAEQLERDMAKFKRAMETKS